MIPLMTDREQQLQN